MIASKFMRLAMQYHTFSDRFIDCSLEQLALRAQSGDDGAFVSLSERMRPVLRKIAQRYFCNGCDSDDFYQEGMLALLRAVETYRPDGTSSFVNYARVCMTNSFNSLLRMSLSEGQASMKNYIPIDSTEIPNPDSLEDSVIFSDELNSIRRFINSELSETERKVAVLYISGYSYEEISARIGVKVKAVDNALQRVRRKLRTR